MKAWRFQRELGLENLELIEVSSPEPGWGEAVVRMHACSLNYRDLVVSKGGYGRAVTAPLTPCSDGAGEVIKVGPGVSRVKPGDRVMPTLCPAWIDGPPNDANAFPTLGGQLDGVLAEEVCLSADALVPIPQHLSYEEAAALPCAAVTAWQSLFDSGDLRPGQTVLIQGSGGVSVFALQFAKMAGARVFATSGSDAKLQRLRDMGAEAGVNYKTTPDWDKPARAFTANAGVDHVIEVGGAGTLPTSFKAVRRGGHIALIGVLSGQGNIDPRFIFVKQLKIQGIHVGSRAMFEAMNSAISNSRLKPVIDRVFPFDQAKEAMNYLESGAHFGKVCIRVA